MKRLLSFLLLFLLAAAPASAAVIPPQGIDISFQSFSGISARPAVVLCESLSVCDTPDGQLVHTLSYGESFLTYETADGWINCYYSDGAQTGWVRSDYVLVDPAYYVTDAPTAVYAYDDPSAPRVALLPAGEQLPIICDTETFFVVSLRGAVGFILKTGAHLSPDAHELSQNSALILSESYLLENSLADPDTLAAFHPDFSYFGAAQVGWVVLFKDDAGQIIWQVSLEKHTGTVLEAVAPSQGHG